MDKKIKSSFTQKVSDLRNDIDPVGGKIKQPFLRTARQEKEVEKVQVFHDDFSPPELTASPVNWAPELDFSFFPLSFLLPPPPRISPLDMDVGRLLTSCFPIYCIHSSSLKPGLNSASSTALV